MKYFKTKTVFNTTQDENTALMFYHEEISVYHFAPVFNIITDAYLQA